MARTTRMEQWAGLTTIEQLKPLVAGALDEFEEKQDGHGRMLLAILVFTATTALALSLNLIAETFRPDRPSPVAMLVLYITERIH